MLHLWTPAISTQSHIYDTCVFFFFFCYLIQLQFGSSSFMMDSKSEVTSGILLLLWRYCMEVTKISRCLLEYSLKLTVLEYPWFGQPNCVVRDIVEYAMVLRNDALLNKLNPRTRFFSTNNTLLILLLSHVMQHGHAGKQFLYAQLERNLWNHVCLGAVTIFFFVF